MNRRMTPRMNRIYREQALQFDAGDARLVGIVTTPSVRTSKLGVLIVVGGPQYRVGSHRQLVLLARALAARGFAVMRFDCSGMGDSTGPALPFTDRDRDIRAAIDAFVEAEAGIDRIAIWGLCDAASAALFYAPHDARVAKLVLLNPWVRSDAGLARTHLKHYYTARLTDRAFWSKLLRGQVGIGRALRGLVSTFVKARRGTAASEQALSFQTRMARGWKRFRGDILLICSGDDLTAREFIDHASSDAEWAGLLAEMRVARCDVAEADHTFSRAAWRDQVAAWTADWLAEPASARELLQASFAHEVL
jgi:exosortase A-associated hydrolase 1